MHTLKKALINYRKNVEAIQRLNWKLEEISTKHYEGGTSNVIRMPEGIPKDISKIISEFLEKEKEIITEVNLLSMEIEIVNKFIESLFENKQIFIDKFIIRFSINEIETKYHYSSRTKNRKMNYYINTYSKI